ncbi:Methyl-accepting transducer domain-containing protein [Vibrio crassostreae]|nr:Methyl-accepting transducer domain-containing protein [Vibrio crassostreae]CAK1759343.1 Methyl-accepting transducer domain-containing protein [Vibrio crassostreae]CAK1759912.1 Methyl-accepting transducer domain-containing protein [Vibrio crassostreae]CAK1759913.1 Methyl-accepting transducer domain-containing protein [Vibrio crassostreae]CAK1760505.1 Methyl-accepting transducer domain-containing protein [Vibrio crassostreae]
MPYPNDSLQPAKWAHVHQRLKPALRDYYQQAQTQVVKGLEVTYQISDTVMLLRGERLKNNTKELVVVGLAGDMATGTLAAVEHAKRHGFDSVRAHFYREGAKRFIARRLKLPVQEIERRGDERILQIRLADMGGRSSSRSRQSNSTTTTNTSSSAAVGRDNTGVMLSGVSDSDINLTMTDHGAMAIAGRTAEEAFDFGARALRVNESVVDNSLNVVDNSLRMVDSTVDEAFGFGSSVLEEQSEVSQHAIDSIKSMAGQQTETTKAAIALANNAKAREQTGTNESDNSTLKKLSLILGIIGTMVTIGVVMTRRVS